MHGLDLHFLPSPPVGLKPIPTDIPTSKGTLPSWKLRDGLKRLHKQLEEIRLALLWSFECRVWEREVRAWRPSLTFTVGVMNDSDTRDTRHRCSCLFLPCLFCHLSFAYSSPDICAIGLQCVICIHFWCPFEAISSCVGGQRKYYKLLVPKKLRRARRTHVRASAGGG